ncbi:hypothetical protein Taro_009212 [Colocasia esculenta]|uniref:BZIP domain-containing protein n=1 Tax=Colocasia esculenta TaxID=4460 RepID=A0A843TVR6_COLES|nr:hypothetical protein [Colocasia esculenta]
MAATWQRGAASPPPLNIPQATPVSPSAVMAAKGDVLFTASAAARASPPCSRGEDGGGGGEGGGASERAVASRQEPLEDVEVNAALALANFAQMALLEREGHGGGGGGWRENEEGFGRAEESEGSSRKRLKGELAAGGAVVGKGAPEQGETWTVASSSPLHQAEKEARRLRRVLANRESARQTIIRRKALCEELAKKAAELSEENENMKMEREAAMKEYLSLRDRNEQLKEQMAKTVECEVEEHPSCTGTSQQPTEPPAPSSLLHGSPPWPEFAWPPILKPSGAVSQHSSIRQEKEVPALPSVSFRVPPQRPSWLCPIPFLQPALCSMHPTGNDGGEGPSGGGEHATSRMRDLTSSPTRAESCAEWGSSSNTPEPVTKKTEQAADDTSKLCRTGAACILEAHSASALLTRPFDHVGTVRDAVAKPPPAETQTAEARRRRRELTKLKHLHGWRGRPRG